MSHTCENPQVEWVANQRLGSTFKTAAVELVRLLQRSARGYPRSAHHVLLAHRPVPGEPGEPGEPLAMTGWDHTRTGAWYSHHFPSLSFLRLELSGRTMLQPCFYKANCHDHHSLIAKWFIFIHVPYLQNRIISEFGICQLIGRLFFSEELYRTLEADNVDLSMAPRPWIDRMNLH